MLKSLLKKLFRSPKATVATNDSIEYELTREMVIAHERALKLYDEKRYAEAIKEFDIAIVGETFIESYALRGYALQSLKYHLDAIDDFTSAIKYHPHNANNYFGRSLSKNKLGNYDGAIEDLNKAIKLSLLKTEENQEANTNAKRMGYRSATEFYKKTY